MQRKIRNVVNNYTATEVKVREATSNDPWGPSSILMAEISTLTFDVLSRAEVMNIIWKRLNDHGKNWRHVYKSLVLLTFLVRTSSDRVVRECRDKLIFIQTLRDFQHCENGLDCGLNIREAAKKLYEMLKDERRLKEERHRALRAKSSDYHMHSSSIGDLSSDQFSHTPPSSQLTYLDNKHHATLNQHSLGAGLQTTSTQPPTNAKKSEEEDDDEMRVALALSREEHNSEERKRRNDEVRLKMALDESRRTAIFDKERSKQYAPSLVDQADLWDLPTSANNLENPWSASNDPINYSTVDKTQNRSSMSGLRGGGEGLMDNQSKATTHSRNDDFEEIMNRGSFHNDDPLNSAKNNSSNYWLPSLANHSQVGHQATKSSSLSDLLSLDNNYNPNNTTSNNTNSNYNTNNTSNNTNSNYNTNNTNSNHNNNSNDPFSLFDNNSNNILAGNFNNNTTSNNTTSNIILNNTICNSKESNNNTADNNNNISNLLDATNGSNILTFTDNSQEVKVKKKGTAEEFLGANANLVNLDELVVIATKPDTSNPFAMTTTTIKTPLNPFANTKQKEKIPLSQLQASMQPNIQSAAFLQFDNSTYNQSGFTPQVLANQSNSFLPPSLPKQPPIAYINNYNPFL